MSQPHRRHRRPGASLIFRGACARAHPLPTVNCRGCRRAALAGKVHFSLCAGRDRPMQNSTVKLQPLKIQIAFCIASFCSARKDGTASLSRASRRFYFTTAAKTQIRASSLPSLSGGYSLHSFYINTSSISNAPQNSAFCQYQLEKIFINMEGVILR